MATIRRTLVSLDQTLFNLTVVIDAESDRLELGVKFG